MRFAAIADIHSNAAALEAVLADIDALSVADVVNLGDSLSGPLEAGRTADILMRRDFVTVRGNHDRYLLDRPRAQMHDWESDAFDQMSPPHFDWLGGLPVTRVWRDDVFMCHATPDNDNRYWMEDVSPEGLVSLKPRSAIAALADGIEQSLLLCGHSHLPRAVRLDDGRLIVNPGSVGCPAYDDDTPFYHRIEAGTPLACYAIIEGSHDAWQVTFRQIAYDHTAMARLAVARGRADWASALSTGWL